MSSPQARLEAIFVFDEEIARHLIILGRAVADDIVPIQQVVDGQADRLVLVRFVLSRKGRQEIRPFFHGVLCRRGADPVPQEAAAEGRVQFMVRIPYAATDLIASEFTVPVVLFLTLALRVVEIDGPMIGPRPLAVDSIPELEAQILEIFVIVLPPTGFAIPGGADVILDADRVQRRFPVVGPAIRFQPAS